MTIIKTLSAVIIALSICIAQNYNISGTVTDTGGTAIAGAAVKLEKANLTATTETDGSFILVNTNLIKDQINKSTHPKLYAKMNNGKVHITLAEKSSVGIICYNLKGEALSTVQKTMEAGTHSITLSPIGAGVYLYKIKSGTNELIIKSPSIGRISGGTTLITQSLTPAAFASHPKRHSTINDVIAVTKEGYLNYRVIVTNSDTSNIKIKMIVCAGTVTDADGNVYQAVKIGTQVWTVENLWTTKYNDGTPITQDTSAATWSNATTEKFCYYNNTTNTDTIKKYRALYNWYAVDTKKLAPAGWHVPTDAEWNTLQYYLIANGYNWDGTTTGNKIAKSLAAKADWKAFSAPGTIGNNVAENNKSGFSALPGGCRNNDGGFLFQTLGYWWSATEDGAPAAYSRNLASAFEDLYTNSTGKSFGLSVRLVKD